MTNTERRPDADVGRLLTVVLEVGPAIEPFLARFSGLTATAGMQEVMFVVIAERGYAQSLRQLGGRFPAWQVIAKDSPDLAELLRGAIRTPLVGFSPAGASVSAPAGPLDRLAGVYPWLPSYRLPCNRARGQEEPVQGWIASTEQGIRLMVDWLTHSVSLWENEQIDWLSACVEGDCPAGSASSALIQRTSRILAVVPHFGCEPWLDQCLRSLTRQTRPPDGIVVIDDASPALPLEIVRRYPTVTLLAAEENVGPYRLLMAVIRDTCHDAYLLQDADDWSALDRLALLLAEAERTGAELIGSQELRVWSGEGRMTAVCYPTDVNAALRPGPANGLLHPTSLVSRSLVLRLGGFATGLRFGADTEFLFRAHHAGRVVNGPWFCYFRRMRPGSLTSSPDTGMRSPQRQQLGRLLTEREAENASRVAQGREPHLAPLCVAPPIALRHVEGPLLRGRPC